jgi:RNA polymerase sigma-70 factor (ECF subfamily)
MEVVSNSIISDTLFEQVFKQHFKSLHAYAYTILRDEDAAEDIVQQVFVKLWEKREETEITQSIQAYLYRMVYNSCLNFLKHEKVKEAHVSFAKHSMSEGVEHITKTIAGKELNHKIQQALQQLPEQCRTIFQLSRFEELKYKEIATLLNLSVKTIENQMGKALRIMRVALAEYLPIGWLIWWATFFNT